MNAWQILGIPPTKDQRAIKRAYAKQLKSIDQEQNPEAFLALRAALEQAQFEAEYLSDDPQDDPFHTDQNSEDLFASTENQYQEDSVPTKSDSSSFTDTSHYQSQIQTEILQIAQLYQQLGRQIQHQYAQSAIQNILIQLKPLLDAIATEEAEPYLEKIAYLLYIHDLENLFDLVAPTPPAQQSGDNLFNIPALAEADEPNLTSENIENEQQHRPRHEEFELFNIPNLEGLDTNTEASPLSSKDIAELELEQAYQALTLQLQHPPAHFSIHDALYHLPKKLLQVNPEQQTLYREKILTLLTQYGLEKWFFFIFDKPQPTTTNNINISNDVENSQQIETPTTPAPQTHEISAPFPKKAPELAQPSLIQRCYWLEQHLEEHDFEDEVYQHFVELLKDLQYATIQEQLDLKEQIENTLAHLNFEQYPSDFERFIIIWDQYYPLLDDCLDSDYVHERLKYHLEYYQNQAATFNEIPEHLHSPIQSIINNEKLKTLNILKLHQYLSRELKIDFPPDYLNNIYIEARDYNANWHYLILLSTQWQSIWWIIWLIISFIYCSTVLNTDISLKLLLLAALTFIITHALSLRLIATILGSPNQAIIIKRFSVIWFLSGLCLAAAPLILSPNVLQHLFYLWIFATIVLFQIAQQLNFEPVKSFFTYSKSIFVDPWIIAISLYICFLSMSLSIEYFLVLNPDDSGWQFSLVLIPLGFLFFNSFFKPLYQSFGYRLDSEPEENFEQNALSGSQIVANSAFLLFRLVLIISPIYFFIKDPIVQSYLYCGAAIFCSLFLLTFPQTLSYYLTKYLSYLIFSLSTYMLDLSLFSVIALILAAFSLFKDLRYRSQSTNESI